MVGIYTKPKRYLAYYSHNKGRKDTVKDLTNKVFCSSDINIHTNNDLANHNVVAKCASI